MHILPTTLHLVVLLLVLSCALCFLLYDVLIRFGVFWCVVVCFVLLYFRVLLVFQFQPQQNSQLVYMYPLAKHAFHIG